MRLKKEGSCINIENEVDAWSRKTGAHASLFRKRPAGRVPPNLPETHPTLETWCPATKEQGLAGSGAPRPPGGQPIRRGASRRRNKGLRGVKHHVQLAGGPSDPRDVVPRDEGTRVCDVLPVNRTIKKYKIYVTSNLNLLLAIFLILRYIFAIQNPSPGGRSAASLRC